MRGGGKRKKTFFFKKKEKMAWRIHQGAAQKSGFVRWREDSGSGDLCGLLAV